MDTDYMRIALDEARKSGAKGEVPVGAVLVDSDGTVLAASGNSSIADNDPSAHAEMLVLRSAGRKKRNYRLSGTILYVTLEPCAMCAAAMVHARIDRLVFGASDPKGGGVASCYMIGSDGILNHSFSVTGGVLAEECSGLLQDFFRQKRVGKK